MKAGLALMVGSIVISVAVFAVILDGTRDIAEQARYTTYEWQEPPAAEDENGLSTDSTDAVVPSEDPEADPTDIPAPDPVEGLLAVEEPAPLAQYPIRLPDLDATLEVFEDGTHRVTLEEPATAITVKSALQGWAIAKEMPPFSFDDWTPVGDPVAAGQQD